MATTLCKISGIDYDATFATNLYKNSSDLAGVLGLASTKDLWALLTHDPVTKPILEGWLNEQKNIGARAFRGIHQKHLTDLLTDPAMHPILCAATHPAFSSIGRGLGKADVPMLAKLTGLWYIVRLVRATPAMFARSQVFPGLRLNPYDILHAWKLLKWTTCNVVRKRGMPAKPRAVPATPPVFHFSGYPTLEHAQGDTTARTIDAQTVDTELVEKPIETPKAEDALHQAIFYGLGDGTVRVEDTEPIFVEQEESEPVEKEEQHESDKVEEDEVSEAGSDQGSAERSEQENMPISNEYIGNSDDEVGYGSGYESAEEFLNVIDERAPKKITDTTMDIEMDDDASAAQLPSDLVNAADIPGTAA